MPLDPTDPFSTRPGYIPGRCNAWRYKKVGLCRRYPMKGRSRCARHGGRRGPVMGGTKESRGIGFKKYWEAWRNR